jgi:2,3-bisphosphoglycerate-dependent phosphoglycerate mutase
MTATTLYLIRHAQSLPSAAVHHAEWPLSELDRDQSFALAPLLRQLRIERVFSSPYRRCLDTVRPFLDAHDVPMAVHEDLRERLISHGLIDGFLEIWRRSWEDFHFSLPGCESSAVAQQRFVEAVTGITGEHAGATVGISSHGNVIGLFTNHVDREFRREATEAMRNPDVIRIVAQAGEFHWDRDFRLPGLDVIATDHAVTPFVK